MKAFINELKNKLLTNPKFRYIFIGISSAIILLLVVLIIFLSSGSKKSDITDSSENLSDNNVSAELSPTVSETKPENDKNTTESEEETEEIAEITPEITPELHIGEVQSRIDGAWIKEEDASVRPYAFMINNIKVAAPQAGVGEAKILYEALTEGGITRFMGIYDGIDETYACYERLGSIRSSRHYYASFATEYDAIYLHFGATKYANAKFEELNMVDQVEGMNIGGNVFYRDKSIKAPHNVFCSIPELRSFLERKNTRLTHDESHYHDDNHFYFNEKALYPKNNTNVFNADGSFEEYTDILEFNAKHIVLSYDRWNAPYLEYDFENGIYTRYQYDDVHTDANTGLPLTFTNIIIQVVKEWDKDRNHYQEMDITDTEGHGFYISYGQCIPITWDKNEKKATMHYYGPDGNLLTINPGKTLISVYPDFREDYLVIE